MGVRGPCWSDEGQEVEKETRVYTRTFHTHTLSLSLSRPLSTSLDLSRPRSMRLLACLSVQIEQMIEEVDRGEISSTLSSSDSRSRILSPAIEVTMKGSEVHISYSVGFGLLLLLLLVLVCACACACVCVPVCVCV